VKYKGHILIRKIFTIFLIGIMLLINAIQLFHTHPIDPAPKTIFNNTKVTPTSPLIRIPGRTKSDHCPICDFRLTQDTETTAFFIVHSSASNAVLLRTAPLQFHNLPFYSTSSGRAPPSFI
jgi:hypothetical protein